MWPEVSVLDRTALGAVLTCQGLLAGGLGPLPPGSTWDVPTVGTEAPSADKCRQGEGE